MFGKFPIISVTLLFLLPLQYRIRTGWQHLMMKLYAQISAILLERKFHKIYSFNFFHETEIHYKSSTNKFHAKQTAKLSDTSIHYVRNVIKKGKQEEEKKLLIEIVFSFQESGKARNTKRILNGTPKQAIHGQNRKKCVESKAR